MKPQYVVILTDEFDRAHHIISTTDFDEARAEFWRIAGLTPNEGFDCRTMSVVMEQRITLLQAGKVNSAD